MISRLSHPQKSLPHPPTPVHNSFYPCPSLSTDDTRLVGSLPANPSVLLSGPNGSRFPSTGFVSAAGKADNQDQCHRQDVVILNTRGHIYPYGSKLLSARCPVQPTSTTMQKKRPTRNDFTSFGQSWGLRTMVIGIQDTWKSTWYQHQHIDAYIHIWTVCSGGTSIERYTYCVHAWDKYKHGRYLYYGDWHIIQFLTLSWNKRQNRKATWKTQHGLVHYLVQIRTRSATFRSRIHMIHV